MTTDSGQAVLQNFDIYDYISKSIRPKKEQAIIVDLDGTLANHEQRNPYEWREAMGDTVDPIVEEFVHTFSSRYTILICSGRPEPSREINEQWMSFYNIPFDKMFLRKRKDMRPDHQVKKEIYDKYIQPNYEVKFVLDDRNSVVDMWRDLGLKCLQVAPGDF